MVQYRRSNPCLRGKPTGCRIHTGKEQSIAAGCTAAGDGAGTGSCIGLKFGSWQRAKATGGQE